MFQIQGSSRVRPSTPEWESLEGSTTLESGVKDSSELLLCGCWEMYLGPVKSSKWCNPLSHLSRSGRNLNTGDSDILLISPIDE